jgi:hypothetical protein
MLVEVCAAAAARAQRRLSPHRFALGEQVARTGPRVRETGAGQDE